MTKTTISSLAFVNGSRAPLTPCFEGEPGTGLELVATRDGYVDCSIYLPDFQITAGSDVTGIVENRLQRLAWLLLEMAELISTNRDGLRTD